MQQFFSYWFWPLPGGWHYQDPKVQALLIGCLALIVLAFVIKFWRTRMKNPVTKTLSKSWTSAAITFGIIAAILVVSRVETIQFISMQALWAVWGLSFVAYVILQIINFKNRHYVVLQKQRTVDVRDKYLPRKKR